MLNINTLIIILIVVHFEPVTGQKKFLDQTPRSMNKNLCLEISLNKGMFCVGEEILINYKIKNISKKPRQVLLFKPNDLPMGMGTSILDSNNISICEYTSKHFLSSQIYTAEQLKHYYQTIDPEMAIEGQITLQNIPIFSGQIKNRTIPIGSYQIHLILFSLISNTIQIEIIE